MEGVAVRPFDFFLIFEKGAGNPVVVVVVVVVVLVKALTRVFGPTVKALTLM